MSENTNTRPVFYTEKDHNGPAVAIWENKTKRDGSPVSDKAPQYRGTIDGVEVGLYERNGGKGPFFAVVNQAKTGEKMENIGTANARVNDKGIPLLAVTLNGREETIWANVSKGADPEMIKRMGFDAEPAQKKSPRP